MVNPPQAQSEEHLRGLEGPEAIRLRPGMYVGGTDIKALHHLIYEVVDNSIDEAMAGRCDFIEIVLHADNSVTIHDNGGGIPVGVNQQLGVSTLTAVFTVLHFGAKFGSGAYSASGGLHGIGVKAVNALSDYLIAEVRRDGYLWRQEFSRGYSTSEVEQVRPMEPHEVTGTSVTFFPDATVMQETVFSFETLENRFRQMAYLVKGVMIRLVDERITPVPKEVTFYFEGGVRSFVRYLNRSRDVLHNPISGNGEFKFKYAVEGKELDGVMQVDFAFQYSDTTNTTELAFANTIYTADGGTHLTGIRSAITRVLNTYARKTGFLKDKDSNFTGSQTLEGLTAIVSIRHPNPQFENQTKGKLMNTEVSGAVSNVVAESFADYLENNPKDSKAIIEKCITTQRIQDALAKQRELLLNDRKTFLSNTTLPGKLADCAERGERTELFIVEGDSAGGSAKQARDRHFQAILPVFGKMLNTERVNINKILDSDKIRTVIMALGTGIREDFNLEKLRYGRLILMSVAGDEPTLVLNHRTGSTEYVKVGALIDDCLAEKRHARDYSVMCFDQRTHRTRFKPLKAVIRHEHQEPMYKLVTRYKRSVKVTASHSVFAYEDGQVVLKKGSAIREGDYLVASRRLPRPAEALTTLDLLDLFRKADLLDGLYVQGDSVRQIAAKRVLDRAPRGELLNEPRVILTEAQWQSLVKHRQAAGLLQMQVAQAIGVKQPITISHWERGVNRPILPHFEAYVQTIGVQDAPTPTLLPSKLAVHLQQDDSSKNARWREVSDYKRLADFSDEEFARLGENVSLVPQAHTDAAFPRHMALTRDLSWFLGWFMAEGTLSRHQVSLNLGEKDERFVDELSAAIEATFGERPRRHSPPESKGIKFYFQSVKAARLLRALGLGGQAHEKRVPDLLFSLPEALQLAFLEGYFLGDGTISGTHLSITTTSPDVRDSLLYLLGQLGIVVSVSEIDPLANGMDRETIWNRRSYFTLSISGKAQLGAIRAVWGRHANAPQLDAHLARPAQVPLDFVTISDDLIGLRVTTAEQIDPVGEYVYDFSVQDDENFICGTGGICAHNSDADVDGAHIRTLMLTFFFRYMQPIVTAGRLFIAQPPLFRLEHKKQVQYVYPESKMRDEQLLTKWLQNYPEPDKVVVQRYKGLGEMNPEQLWETTMNPEKRTLLQVTLDDAAEADRTFDMLMGPEVPPRRAFIVAHSKDATLDI